MADELSRSTTERQSILKGSIGATLAAIAFAADILDKAPKFFKQVEEFVPARLRIIIYVALALYFIRELWRGLKRKSRLLDGDALRIDPTNPHHLRGRVDEIERIVQLLPRHFITFLTGESGAGKTFLLKQGLLPRLREPHTGDRHFLPLYMENYGADAEQGPRNALKDALASTSIAAVSNSNDRVYSEDPIINWLDHATCAGPTPLLIFDQLDDYIATHLATLRPDGNWIDADALCALNPFWRAIRERLQKKQIALMFVNRSEYAEGHDAFRLHSGVGSRSVTSVPAAEFNDLLAELGRKAVSNPDAGWDRFLEELLEQYKEAKPFLPVRIRFALDAIGAHVLDYLHP